MNRKEADRFAGHLSACDDIRSLDLPRFPFVVVYTQGHDAARVHRAFHTKQDIPAVLTATLTRAHPLDPS